MDFREPKFLLKHSSVYGLGSVAGQALSFFLLPFYTHYLTPADYGVMALINAINGLIGLVIGLGVTSAISRFYYEYDSEEERNLVVSSAYWISFVVLVCFLPLAIYCAPLLSGLVFRDSEYGRIFSVATSALLFGLNVNVGMTYLRVKAKSVQYVQVTLIQMILGVGCNVYFIAYLKTGVIGIFYSSLISAVIFFIYFSILVLRRTKFLFSYNITKEMIVYSFPLIFSSIFRLAVNESDKYFINYFFSPLETGIYSIAQKLGTAIHILITSPFLQTYMPRRFQIMNKDDAKENYSMILNYYLLLISSIGLLISILSQEIIIVMTSENFYSAAKYIPFVVLSMIIFGMKYHFEIGIVINKKTKYLAYINGITSAVNILLNVILIQKFKIWGAILSINISYLLTTCLTLICSQRLYRVRFDLFKVIQILLLCIAFYIISIFIVSDNIIVTISCKLLLFSFYIFFLVCFRLIPLDLIRVIRKRFLRFRRI